VTLEGDSEDRTILFLADKVPVSFFVLPTSLLEGYGNAATEVLWLDISTVVVVRVYLPHNKHKSSLPFQIPQLVASPIPVIEGNRSGTISFRMTWKFGPPLPVLCLCFHIT